MAAKKVLSIGQCAADHGSIAWLVQNHFDAEVTAAATSADALGQLRRRSFHLILVNRILDADGSSGLHLIEELKSDEKLKEVPVMLVSNYEDAQQEAAARGAMPGFGKAALRQPATLATLREILG
jgi:CheY-like chemotaxis protein